MQTAIHVPGPLQGVFHKGGRIIGDLVLITGSGQHSAGSPVLRSSVQRLLASLQLCPDDADVAASAPAAGGMGTAFAGYARFTSGSREQHGGAGQMPLPGVKPQQQQDQAPPADTGVLGHVHRGYLLPLPSVGHTPYWHNSLVLTILVPVAQCWWTRVCGRGMAASPLQRIWRPGWVQMRPGAQQCSGPRR